MTTPDPAALAAQEPPEQRLHPWSWLFVLLQQLKQFVVPLVALLVLGRGDRYALYSLIGVGVLGLMSVWQYFTYRYRITEDSLVVRSGIFERSLRQIPFARIHNVAVHQSLLHRLFGVAEVRLESAGGQKPEAQMRVLKLDEALALERLIRRRGEVAADAPSTQATPDSETLLALPTSEVVRLGLVSNRGMVIVAGAFALSWQVFPEEMIENGFRQIGREIFGYASQLHLGWMATAVAALAVLLLALALLRGFSVAIALVQFHGFRLQAHGRRLTVERGLLTRLRTSASRRRIQAWTLEEGLLHRLLKRRSLHVDIAVSEQQNEKRALRELAPIATADICDALAQQILPRSVQWPPPAWHALHPRAWLRLWLPGLLFSIVAALALFSRFGPWGLLALAWIPWAWYAARQHASRAGYALDDALIAIREGWWSRHWRFAEIDKLQALQLRQSPLDRRTGMASIWMDTAGAGSLNVPLRIRHLPAEQARALHSKLSRMVASRPLRW